MARLSYEAMDDSWRKEAQCRGTDPDLFFPVGNTGLSLEQIENAKEFCRNCRVAEACLIFALETNQDSGIWGGFTEEERRPMRRQYIRERNTKAM